jgi:hypothetical protein
VEEWKSGRVEGWKSGRMEEWKDGRVEGWKGGRMEEWKGGRVNDAARREPRIANSELFRKVQSDLGYCPTDAVHNSILLASWMMPLIASMAADVSPELK